ncbi:MAG: hypothetical protein ACRDPE_08380 [Solirubrobacterales bacterium]
MKAPSVTSFHSLRGILAVAVAIALCAGALSACGGGSAVTDAGVISQARHQAVAHVHSEERLRRLEARLHEATYRTPYTPSPEYTPSSEYAQTPEPGTGGSCGGELSANAYTSCPFAEAVEQAYFETVGSGPGVVVAYSPVTERSYSMTCGGSPHECTGGDHAVVYFP